MDGKRGSGTECALCRDVATHALTQSAADSKIQTRTTEFTTCVLRLRKLFDNFVQLFWGNADSGVTDDKSNPTSIF